MELTSQYQYIGRSNKILSVNKNNGYQLLLYAKAVGNNTKGINKVTVRMVLAALNSGSFYKYSTKASASIAGTAAFSVEDKPSAAWNIGAFSEGGVSYKNGIEIGVGSVDVKGNVSSTAIKGTWEFTASGTAYYTPNTGAIATVNVTVDLPVLSEATEPRLSKSTFKFGDEIVISTPADNTSCTHTLNVEIGGCSEQIASGVKSSYKWSKAATEELALYVTDSDKGYGYIICDTYLGGTKLGTKKTAFTIVAGENLSPTAKMKLSPVGNTINGLYLQYRTQLLADFTGSTFEMGTSGKQVDLQIEQTVNEEIVTRKRTGTNMSTKEVSIPLTNVGKVTVTGTITDKRELTSAPVTETIEVHSYFSPYIKANQEMGNTRIICERYDDNDLNHKLGEGLHISATACFNPVLIEGEPNNSCCMQFRYRESQESYPDEWIDLITHEESISYYSENSNYWDIGYNYEYAASTGEVYFDKSKLYYVEIRVVDKLNEPYTLEFILPAAEFPFHLGRTGKSIGIGQLASSDPNRVDIGWSVYFHAGAGREVLYEAEEGKETNGTLLTGEAAEKVRKFSLVIARTGRPNEPARCRQYLLINGGDYFSSVERGEDEITASGYSHLTLDFMEDLEGISLFVSHNSDSTNQMYVTKLVGII